jgi:hypothetical protein
MGKEHMENILVAIQKKNSEGNYLMMNLYYNKEEIMSWSFDLCDPVTKKILKTEEKHFMFGTTICVGGDTAMTLDVTYNYSDIINKVIKSKEEYAHFLSGKSGAEVIPILKDAISKLSDDVDDDYWKATEGNAKRALSQLLAFSQMRPDGIWYVY